MGITSGFQFFVNQNSEHLGDKEYFQNMELELDGASMIVVGDVEISLPARFNVLFEGELRLATKALDRSNRIVATSVIASTLEFVTGDGKYMQCSILPLGVEAWPLNNGKQLQFITDENIRTVTSQSIIECATPILDRKEYI